MDVHTASWIVDECLGGDLIKGRTVLLVTHNIILAKSVADYIVLLAVNGTIRSQGPVDDVIRREEEAIEVVEKEDVAGEADSPPAKKQAGTKSGKLIVAEEVALGHIGWTTCKSYFSVEQTFTYELLIDKVYLNGLGGSLFYIPAYLSIVALALLPIVQKAFLAYWSGQYETMRVEDVPVRLYVFLRSLRLDSDSRIEIFLSMVC